MHQEERESGTREWDSRKGNDKSYGSLQLPQHLLSNRGRKGHMDLHDLENINLLLDRDVELREVSTTPRLINTEVDVFCRKSRNR